MAHGPPPLIVKHVLYVASTQIYSETAYNTYSYMNIF
jgi:hypothetical protein